MRGERLASARSSNASKRTRAAASAAAPVSAVSLVRAVCSAGGTIGAQAITAETPRQVVRSPEQVALELPIAGPTSRILAYAIDALLLLVCAIGLFVIATSATPIADWLTERLGDAAGELTGKDAREPGFR